MIRTTALILTTLGALAATPTWAARPFATEDASVMDAGECELEPSAVRTRARGGVKQSRWWVQAACAVGERTQLGLGGGAERGEGLRRHAVALFGKTALHHHSDQGPNFSLAYGAETGRERGDRWRYQGAGVALVASQRLGVSTWSANLGWSRDAIARRSSTTWALAWERPVIASLDAGVEVYGDDRESAWVGIGLRWGVSDSLSLDASFARQTNSARTRVLNTGLTLGW